MTFDALGRLALGEVPDEVFVLVSKDITSGIPTVAKPTIAQVHALTDKDITSGVPTVEKATITQNHALVSKDIATPVPTVEKPTITQVHVLVSKDITSGIPTVTKVVITQVNALVAKNIATTPTVSKPTLGIPSQINYGIKILAGTRNRRFKEDEELMILLPKVV